MLKPRKKNKIKFNITKKRIYFIDFIPDITPNKLISLNIFKGLEECCKRLSSGESSKENSVFWSFLS